MIRSLPLIANNVDKIHFVKTLLDLAQWLIVSYEIVDI